MRLFSLEPTPFVHRLSCSARGEALIAPERKEKEMCSRIQWKAKGQPVLVGRNMDWTEKLPDKPASYGEAVAGVLSVIRNMATPIGFVDPVKPNVSPTQWRTISDLTNKRYYFELTNMPNVVWSNLRSWTCKKEPRSGCSTWRRILKLPERSRGDSSPRNQSSSRRPVQPSRGSRPDRRRRNSRCAYRRQRVDRRRRQAGD